MQDWGREITVRKMDNNLKQANNLALSFLTRKHYDWQRTLFSVKENMSIHEEEHQKFAWTYLYKPLRGWEDQEYHQSLLKYLVIFHKTVPFYIRIKDLIWPNPF